MTQKKRHGKKSVIEAMLLLHKGIMVPIHTLDSVSKIWSRLKKSLSIDFPGSKLKILDFRALGRLKLKILMFPGQTGSNVKILDFWASEG